MSQIFNKSGGYRKLHSFNFATIIHLGTMRFCKRFIDWKQDPLGKTLGQMVGASRSGKQNIVEGSERAKTSAETEIKLTDVAKGSLAELLGDLEDFLAERGEIPWSIHSEEHKALSAITLAPFEYTDDLLHDYWRYLHAEKKKFDRWLEHENSVVVANALIVLTQRALSLLGKQLQSLEAAFLEKGGIRELHDPGAARGPGRRRPGLPRLRQAHAQAEIPDGRVLGMLRLPRLPRQEKHLTRDERRATSGQNPRVARSLVAGRKLSSRSKNTRLGPAHPPPREPDLPIGRAGRTQHPAARSRRVARCGWIITTCERRPTP